MDRHDACRLITANWEQIRLNSVVHVVGRLSRMTSEEACARFLKAGERYGEFDIHSIDATLELEDECLDIPCYIAIETFQK